ncbi:uncharacterized protein LOC129002047 [Macrosteles quadrilineatus]|uniref:uncharacterized protein LOC129002047 n=1 Tax=Macrosteles quadrilineatus TaxID=74068 RepID=UPI0023E2DA4A|nr:uncharacterized protein LOC129002047 [Macrosteles quadrilineatus]
MSIYKNMINSLNKEAEDCMKNMRILTDMYPHVRAPLLAALLVNNKSLQETILYLNRCFAGNQRKEKRGPVKRLYTQTFHARTEGKRKNARLEKDAEKSDNED